MVRKYLGLRALAEEQGSVPLLLGHCVVHQPNLCQTSQMCQVVKLSSVSDAVGGSMQVLQACEAGQVSQAAQAIVAQVEAPQAGNAAEGAGLQHLDQIMVQDELSQAMKGCQAVNACQLVAMQVQAA